MSKWYGQSEELLRMIFADARKQRSIVFFDEIDSIAGRRTDNFYLLPGRSASADREPMQRLVEGSRFGAGAATLASMRRRAPHPLGKPRRAQ